MEKDKRFNPCVPKPVKCGNNTVMVFETLFFELKGSRFKLIGAETTEKDTIHDVMNIDTREIKQITHSRLIQILLG